jgi:hypothetical protein
LNKTSLHQLPLPAAYTGPQLALQVTPSQLQQPPQQPSQQGQQPQCYTVTPTPQLLAELLPLLTSHCLAKVQQQHAPQQQMLASFRKLLPQAGRVPQAFGQQGTTAPPDFLSFQKQSVESCVCSDSVRDAMQHIFTLLSCAVVPATYLTATELQAAADADSTVPYRSVTKGSCGN